MAMNGHLYIRKSYFASDEDPTWKYRLTEIF